MSFTPATRSKVKARIAIGGMSKSGKSLTALGVMRGIVGPDGKIAAIDTENKALSLYAGKFPGTTQPSGFDVENLTNCSPDEYIRLIGEAARARYDGLVIDSTSQEWGAILELVDGNTDKFFGGWKGATPKHNAFIRAIVAAPLHVIVTVRQKDDYAIEQRDGKAVPVKVGTELVQRKQFEYEFNAVWTMDLEHNIRVTHSAIDFMPNGTVIPGVRDTDAIIEIGKNLRHWLDAGDGEWVPPVYKKSFYVNDKEYISAGIERDTFVKITNLGLAYNKTVKGGNAKKRLQDLTSKSAIADLTEEEGKLVTGTLEAEIAKAKTE